jgi:Patatin-like phospholipase
VIKKKSAKKTAPKPKESEKEQERAGFSAEDEVAAIVPSIADARVWGDSETEFAKLLPQANGPWLAISGGGSDGAYGGGVLAGWTQSGTRPEFAVVTGASIGALIAPFAFLGPRYDDEIRKSFTSMTAADIFEDRATRDSLFDYWPLKRQVEQRVNTKLLAEIAAEHARGRRLFVATTNLDAGRRVIWNMGAIAARGDDKGLQLFRDVLLASCSIPGFFSPVAIEVEANGKRFQEIHGDATLTTPFFVVPESMLSASSTSRPPLSQVYVIVNSKRDSEFQMPDRNIPGVLSRSIAVALTTALRSEVALLHVGAQRHGISVRIAHVDPAFDHPSRGPFDGKYMEALYEFGVIAGKRGTAFQDGLSGTSLRGSNAQ